MKKIVTWLVALAVIFTMISGWGTTLQAKEATASLSQKAIILRAGKSAFLKLKNGKGKTKWKSSNKKIATVDSKGTVKAKKAGTATVTATNAKKKFKCTVTVSEKTTKTLVAYFSLTGTTADAAKKVQAATGGDLVRIQPRTAYTSDYDTLLETAQKEYDQKANPARATKIYNMDQYDTVFVGYPIWWGDCPRIVQAFLKDYGMKGKTVIPFCTSGGSGIGGSMSSVRAAAKNADVLKGRDLTGKSRTQVKKWVDSLAASDTGTEGTDSSVPENGTEATNESASGNEVRDTDASAFENGTGAANESVSGNGTEAEVAMEQQENGKILVAYFSATGTTRPYAQLIAKRTKGTLFEIVPKQTYTSEDINYNSDCRANREQNDSSARPAIASEVTGLEDYSIVFLGYPIWWGTCPRIIDTFMESYDFTGKTVIPFCTSGSSGIGTSESHIRSSLPSAEVSGGHRMAGESDALEWLSQLGY